jgi:hypothetical protein
MTVNNSLVNAGVVYVYENGGSTWLQAAYLTANNREADDQFGFSVAIRQDTLLIGALREDGGGTGVNPPDDNAIADSGAAYVFVRQQGDWTQQAYIKPSNTDEGDRFGWTVSLSGNRAVVGAPRESSAAAGVGGNQADNSAFRAGAVYLFVRQNGQWSQQDYVKASNTDAEDEFGFAVSISAENVIVSAQLEDSNATGVNGDQGNNLVASSGAIYVFSSDLVFRDGFDAL